MKNYIALLFSLLNSRIIITIKQIATRLTTKENITKTSNSDLEKVKVTGFKMLNIMVVIMHDSNKIINIINQIKSRSLNFVM